MNLLYTLTTYPPTIGGAQLHQHLLAQQLHSRHSLQVLTQWRKNRTDWLLGTTLRAPEKGQDEFLDSISIHPLTISKKEKLLLFPYVLLYYPWMSFALPKIAQCLQTKIQPYANNANLIHNVRIGREGLSFASYYAAKKADIPFVFTPVHHPRWVGWRYQQYLNLYQKADRLLALTEVEKQTLVDLGVKPEKITVTGIGSILAPHPKPQSFREQYKITGPMVLFLGQHYAYKGYRQLLAAAPTVWGKYPETQFIFIGPPVKNSESYFQNGDRRILRLGAVDLQTKTDALAACDCLCVPSSQESFGGVYTEAWSFKKPVIGCDIPAVAEVIDHGENGLLVAQDPKAIAASILEILGDSHFAQTMGEAGYQKVQQRFTWEKLAAITETAYLQAIASA
ncbi:glycosyl transferase family 1 [Picosynechococcus sp. PCC 7003]|uniref:glycosyltransferase family 4 protein n=1 Tax=Picosynechococcus sp. PCC 7003 TaxID=374981 RepID=UPI0008108569|nr:glycosyltransferase family 4 protein [Picosynechococcus sp. PCC 7003]ANV83282.1 glycosyl transferase family 1 [Picosynechococcus sp. PCC 7003]